jgi:DNA-binding HxlR family transcriptional regulator
MYTTLKMQSTLSLADLSALGRSRWAVPLLADLAANRGARFVELLHRLALPRDSLVRTLHVLNELGWVMRNPGHGHPLRPEYLLTLEGARIAVGATAIAATQTQLGLTPGSLTRWSMPLVRTIGSSEARFNELARALAAATPRAISQGLQTLAGNDLVSRQVLDGYPPATLYRLTPAGFLLADAGGLVSTA